MATGGAGSVGPDRWKELARAATPWQGVEAEKDGREGKDAAWWDGGRARWRQKCGKGCERWETCGGGATGGLVAEGGRGGRRRASLQKKNQKNKK